MSFFCVPAKRGETKVVTSRSSTKTYTCLSFLPRDVRNKPQLAAACASQLLFAILLVCFACKPHTPQFAPSFFSQLHSAWALTFSASALIVSLGAFGALQTHRQQLNVAYCQHRKVAGSSFSHIRYFRLLETFIFFASLCFLASPF